jgi:lipopolysaccharide export system protein LptA
VTALIRLNNSNNITITSNYGKYNTDNFDTIFSENVIIEYLDGKITGGYLDFSIKRNSMIISKDIVYTNLENVLKADVMEMNIETKDSKIFMYEDDKKVNIKSIN